MPGDCLARVPGLIDLLTDVSAIAVSELRRDGMAVS